jgi:hypothetical protein
MVEPDPTDADVYQMILSRLRDFGAVELAQQIEMVVAKGSVAPGLAEAGQKKTDKFKIVQALSSRDSLTIALEFLIAASELPLVVDYIYRALACDAVEWRPDEPGPRAEDMAVMRIPTDIDLIELKRRIQSLIDVMTGLTMNHPEIV